MKQKIKAILIFVLCVDFAALLYPIVMGYWTSLLIPITCKLPRTRMIIGTWLAAGGASGAAICAFLLAWPLGFLTKEKPIIIGTAFGLISAVLPFIAFIKTNTESGFNALSTTVFAVEQITLVATSTLFTCWGSRVAKRRAMEANKEDAPDQKAVR